MIRHFSIPATALLAALVLLAPLPFASVMPLERAAAQAVVFVALTFAVAAARDGVVSRPVLGIALIPITVAVIGLLQSLPWPRFVVELVAADLVTAWDAGASLRGAPPPEWVPFTLTPAVTHSSALAWLAAAAAFVAAAVIGRDRGHRRVLGLALLGSAVFTVAYGTERWFRGSNTLWGIEVPGDVGRLRGTFVNPDHYAMFLAMVIAVTTAWLWWTTRRALDGGRLERQLGLVAPPALAMLLLFVALAFTGSRAGFIAVVGAVTVQGFLLVWHYKRLRVGLYALLALTVGIVGVLSFGVESGFGRFLDTSAYDLTWSKRYEVWAATLDLWWTLPWTGSGLGTFRQAFPLVQSAGMEPWDAAHSDYLELLAALGIVAVPLLGALLWFLSRHLLAALRRGRRSEDRAAALAALGAAAAVAAHSLVDFGLQMPANALIFAVLCGAAAGVPVYRSMPKIETTDRRRRRRRRSTERTDQDEAAERAAADAAAR
ncbi:MAG: O-antigen ligase family protein [Acidobacteriota bacterium]